MSTSQAHREDVRGVLAHIIYLYSYWFIEIPTRRRLGASLRVHLPSILRRIEETLRRDVRAFLEEYAGVPLVRRRLEFSY